MRNPARFLIGLIILIGCAGCGLDRSYVRADRLTHGAIAPRFERYVREDQSLDADQRETILRTVELWDRRIEEAERVTIAR